MKPKFLKHIFPICIGHRALGLTRVANSGENCGFSYNVYKEERIFFSLYDFPISQELEDFLKQYANEIIDCDYEEWFPCGDEHRIQIDTDLTSKLCYFLNSYFNLKYCYYRIEFIPGTISCHPEQFKKHGPIYYLIDVIPEDLIS